MAQEIERKFLVVGDGWKATAKRVHFRQGYLSIDPERTVRIRMAGERAYVTIKGLSVGISRLEFEYEIPLEDAVEMLETLSLEPVIDKHRSTIEFEGLQWEVDEFHGANEGLVVAEVELTSADEAINLPLWVGEEVSGDPRYFNANLVVNPFMNWKELKSEDS